MRRIEHVRCVGIQEPIRKDQFETSVDIKYNLEEMKIWSVENNEETRNDVLLLTRISV